MLKKLVIVGVIGFVAVAAIRHTKAGSYLRAEVTSILEDAEATIPPEQEIARLRSEIKALDKDLSKVMEQVAKERVEVNQLKEKSDELRIKQTQDKDLLQMRAEAIKKATGSEHVVFNDRKMSVPVAKAELEAGVKRFTANQKSLDSLDVTISSRERIKDSLEKQLDTLKTQRIELLAAVDGLEAELNSLKLQQMESKYQTDDSRLSKIKEDMRALKTKLEVEREKLKLLPSTMETSVTHSNKSVDDIMAPLSTPAKPAAEGKARVE
jgi:chromosome segregation ATPase